MADDERILTSIAIMREKYNLGTCEVCACVGQPIHSSQYLYTHWTYRVYNVCAKQIPAYIHTHIVVT